MNEIFYEYYFNSLYSVFFLKYLPCSLSVPMSTCVHGHTLKIHMPLPLVDCAISHLFHKASGKVYSCLGMPSSHR